MERVKAGGVFAAIAAVVVIARLLHSHVLWADDNLPLAAAMQVARGKILYKEVWFDKPPLVAWIDLLWGARAGVLLRLAGAAYVIGVAALAYLAARAKWSEREGLFAAIFAAFFLTFGLPSAVIPLASDMLLILPHLAAIYFAWRGRAFWSGVACGVGLLCSSKAIFVLAACLLWQWRAAPLLLAGFAAPNAVALAWMWMQGSAGDYYREAWQWGSIYAANTFVDNPVLEGLKRTANFLGFHAALVIGAILALRAKFDWRMAAWIAFSLAGVVLGLRFFPRYYFLLLPPLTVLAARGWTSGSVSRQACDVRGSIPASLNRKPGGLRYLVLIALLAIPVVRFAPSYFTLAESRDLAIDRDSKAAARELDERAKPDDTLFVWGFRPDIFIYSGMPGGTRFLESQFISGVLADRHLFSTEEIAPELTAPNRAEVARSRPTWIVDGLGILNPAMGLAKQPYMADWFAQYQEVARTEFSILYRLR